MATRLGILFAFAGSLAFGGDWNPRLAAQYMDQRQKEWFAWPAANPNGMPCVSCHTGVTYLLARPALSRALGENERTPYEKGLLEGLRSRVGKNEVAELFPKATPPHSFEALGVETVFAALFLAAEDAPAGKLSADTEKAFARLWELQIRDGKNKGAWVWNTFDLDPWEMPESTYYGAALAAVAIGTAPAGYAARPEIQENLAALKAYLRDEQAAQPLHNRLILLWAAAKLPLLLDVQRQIYADDVLKKQQPDGGWTLESLGPWKLHKDAPAAEGSNAYATAIVAFTLQQAGVFRSDPAMVRALSWLRSHQDPKLGVWTAESMNKPHKADSMAARFMQDAATGYAALALLGGGQTEATK
jgi:squalene-hopene/tetraprenyl-beta-curcumene cyclase